MHQLVTRTLLYNSSWSHIQRLWINPALTSLFMSVHISIDYVRLLEAVLKSSKNMFWNLLKFFSNYIWRQMSIYFLVIGNCCFALHTLCVCMCVCARNTELFCGDDKKSTAIRMNHLVLCRPHCAIVHLYIVLSGSTMTLHNSIQRLLFSVATQTAMLPNTNWSVTKHGLLHSVTTETAVQCYHTSCCSVLPNTVYSTVLPHRLSSITTQATVQCYHIGYCLVLPHRLLSSVTTKTAFQCQHIDCCPVLPHRLLSTVTTQATVQRYQTVYCPVLPHRLVSSVTT